MIWNIGDNRNLFLKLKTKLGLYHVELRSKDTSEKITLTLKLNNCQILKKLIQNMEFLV